MAENSDPVSNPVPVFFMSDTPEIPRLHNGVYWYRTSTVTAPPSSRLAHARNVLCRYPSTMLLPAHERAHAYAHPCKRVFTRTAPMGENTHARARLCARCVLFVSANIAIRIARRTCILVPERGCCVCRGVVACVRERAARALFALKEYGTSPGYAG
jgi:hypothetical protein